MYIVSDIFKGLLDIIDSNQLYVNYSDMEDKNHTITDTDKDITTKFYNQK